MIIEKRDYYNRGKIEAIDAIESVCTGLDGYEGFLTGTCLKYLFRWRWKGTSLADLKKADYYLTRLIREEEKKLGAAESTPEQSATSLPSDIKPSSGHTTAQ